MFLGVNGIRLLGRRGGVGRYLEYMLRCWAAQDFPFDEIRVYTPEPVEGIDFSPRIRNVLAPGWGPRGWWEQFHLPRAHGSEAVLFCPSYVAPIFARCPIFLVHHGSYEGYPAAFDWWTLQKAYRIYRASARRADRIVTVSLHSKRDMAKFYGVPESKIEVLPEGVDLDRFYPIDDAAALSAFRREVFGEDAPYLLYVGNSNPRRNIPQMLEAFAGLAGREPRLKFLIIGSMLAGRPVEPIVRALGLEGRVKLLGHAGHDKIVLAYNAADLFIYPSSYEGFGIPALEAMACGTPTIALRNTAFVEFADGVALLAEDARPETLRAAMESILGDPAARERMRKLGPERAADYQWKDIARKTMGLIEGLAREGKGRA